MTHLTYEFDPVAEERWNTLGQAFSTLGNAHYIRYSQVDGEKVDDHGAKTVSFVLFHQPCVLRRQAPPHVSTNVQPWCVEVAGQFSLYFMPNRVLVYQSSLTDAAQYASFPYTLLQHVTVYTNEMTLYHDLTPLDAKYLRSEWLYQKKDGGPDLRYSDNPRYPVVLVGTTSLRMRNDQSILFSLSKVEAAVEAARLFSKALRVPFSDFREPSMDEQPQGRSSSASDYRKSNQREAPPPPPYSKERSAYEILGIRPNASLQEMHASWRTLVQQYHPDRVATMGPEIRELAERKMKEINAAYEALKQQVRQ